MEHSVYRLIDIYKSKNINLSNEMDGYQDEVARIDNELSRLSKEGE